MNQGRRAILLGLTCFVLVTLLFGSAGGAKEDRDGREAAPPFGKLEPGMTPQQVRDRVGAPKRVCRQILYHRYLEQWIYDAPVPVRLTFDCRRGHKPQLLWIHGVAVEKGR